MKLSTRKTLGLGLASALASLSLIPLFSKEGQSVPLPPPSCSEPSITTVYQAIGGTIGHLFGDMSVTSKSIIFDGVDIQATQVSPNEAIFKAPPAKKLGNASVIVYCCCGAFGSYWKTVTYIETNPPLMLGPKQFQNGDEVGFYYGGKVNRMVFFLVNLDGATVSYKGIPVLTNNVFVQMPNTNQVGPGNASFTNLPPLPVGLEIHYQGIFYNGGNEILPSNIGKVTVNG